MSFAHMTVEQYLHTLASDLPAPGGGSASAFCGAQGAGLVTMAAALTLGRKKYSDSQERCQEVVAKGAPLVDALLDQVDKDAASFDLVSAAFKLPQETDAEKSARSEAIQAGTLAATLAPLETMRLALEALRNAKALLEGFNTGAASDLGVAAMELLCGVRGAWLNVCINIPSLKDQAEAARLREQGETILHEAEALAEEIYRAAEKIIMG